MSDLEEQVAFVQAAQKKGFKLFQHPQAMKRNSYSVTSQQCSPFLQPQALPDMATPTLCHTLQTPSACRPPAAAGHENVCGQLDHQTEVARRFLALAELERERMRAAYEAAEYKRMIGGQEPPHTPLKTKVPKTADFSQEKLKSAPAQTMLTAGADLKAEGPGGCCAIPVQAKASTTAVSPAASAAYTPKATRPSPTEGAPEDTPIPAPEASQEKAVLVEQAEKGEAEAAAENSFGDDEPQEEGFAEEGSADEAPTDSEAVEAAAAAAEREAADAVGEAEEEDGAKEALEAEELPGEDD